MVTFISGNIFDSDADILVNPVNCEGVMGAGLAKQFKERFPEYFEHYKQICLRGIKPGDINFYKDETNNLLILSFYTKNKWRNKSKINWIEKGMKSIGEYLCMFTLVNYGRFPKSIAIPKIGCGLGGLKWEEVLPIILKAANKTYWIDWTIYGEEI